MTPEQHIAEHAYVLANSLPHSTVETLANIILTCPQDMLNIKANECVPHHQNREQVLDFLNQWKEKFIQVSSQSVAIALYTAMIAVKKQRDNLSLELVWTGPDTGQVSFRRTEQVILQIIEEAKSRITIVSFAVYKIPNIADALVRASKRGVPITIIVETPDKIDTENEYNTIRALGQDITKCSSVFYWSLEKRRDITGGKPGILHVKCVFADGLSLFISSANMTQQAFTINMELGVLIRGGLLPQKVEELFDLLINESFFVKI